MKTNFLLTCVLAITSNFLYGGTFKKEFVQVPKTHESCHNQAKDLLALFETQTGNKTGAIECLADHGTRADFTLTYTDAAPLPSLDTETSSGDFEAGIYAKEEHCRAQLNTKTLLFEKQTKLKPFLAYCHQIFPNHKWFPLVFAFGQTQTKYWINGYHYYSVPKQFDPVVFRQNVKTALSRLGAELDEVVSFPHMGYGKMAVHYYSKDKVDFELGSYTQTAKIEHCMEQRSLLNAVLKQEFLEPLANYCGQLSVGSYWEIGAVYAGGIPLNPRLSVETFKDYAECMKGRESLTQHYKNNIDKNVLEGLCTYTDKTYKLLLIRKK